MTLKIFRKCIGFIIPEQLGLQKLLAKCMPKHLNTNQKQYQVDTYKLILQHIKWSGAKFRERLFIVDIISLWLEDQTTVQAVMTLRFLMTKEIQNPEVMEMIFEIRKIFC